MVDAAFEASPTIPIPATSPPSWNLEGKSLLITDLGSFQAFKLWVGINGS